MDFQSHHFALFKVLLSFYFHISILNSQLNLF